MVSRGFRAGDFLELPFGRGADTVRGHYQLGEFGKI